MACNPPNNSYNETVTSVNFSKYPQPELSDEPIITKKSQRFNLPVADPILITDLNNSSLQLSTQHSLNTKKSFSVFSPKHSIPSAARFLKKVKKTEDQASINQELDGNLKLLESENSPHKDEIGKSFEIETEKETEAALVFEGDENYEIPHLRWCAFCAAEVVTEIEYVNNEKTFWTSVGIFFAGGIFGCFMLPYMTNLCKGVKLVCHKCKRPIG